MNTEIKVINYQTFQWGPWSIRADENPTLELGHKYYVTLKEFNTKVKALNRLFELHEKENINESEFSCLVSALRFTLSIDIYNKKDEDIDTSGKAVKWNIAGRLTRNQFFSGNIIKSLNSEKQKSKNENINLLEIIPKIYKDESWGKLKEGELESIEMILQNLK